MFGSVCYVGSAFARLQLLLYGHPVCQLCLDCVCGKLIPRASRILSVQLAPD